MNLPSELKTEAALDVLGMPHAKLTSIYYLPKRKAKGRFPGRKAWMFQTAHIERVKLLVEVCNISLSSACRVVAAEIEGRV